MSAEGAESRTGREALAARTRLDRIALDRVVCWGLCVAFAALPVSRPALGGDSSRADVQIRLEAPQDGAVVGDPDAMAFIAGHALAGPVARAGEAFDLMIVIDQSDSTARPAGSDVNGDGRVDRRGCAGVPRGLGLFAAVVGACFTGTDSILAAELLAVRALLGQLDPARTRVGLIAFGGDGREQTPDALVSTPLTANYEQVEAALRAIEERGPAGLTNIEAGVELATREFARTSTAYSSGSAAPERLVLFLSDGFPTLPVRRGRAQNRERAIAAAARSGAQQVRIDTFAIGPEALSEPETLVEMAALTQGRFTPVRDPRDLGLLFQRLDLARVDLLRVRNRTNGHEAEYLMRSADGSFAALVELAPGANTVEIYARADDGSEQTRELELTYLSSAQGQELPMRLVARRNRLLENRLTDLRAQSELQLRRELSIRIDNTRKELAERRERGLRIDPQR
jgi:hypothetical protein